MQIDKKARSEKRARRVRSRVVGTSLKPRLSVKFSNKHIYAQCINDEAGETLVFLSTVCKSVSDRVLPNVDGAMSFGKMFGQKAVGAGVKSVVFDRGSRKYHGVVKAFADAVRSEGVLF